MLRTGYAGWIGQRSYMTLSQVLNDPLLNYPYKDAVRAIDPIDIRFSFQDLQTHAKNMAAALINLRFDHKDTLGIFLPNSLENLVTHLAAAQAGVTLISLNHCTSSDQLKSSLSKHGCMGLVYEPRMLGFNLTDWVRAIPLTRPFWYKITTGQYDISDVHQFRHLRVNDLDPFHWTTRQHEITPDTLYRVDDATGTSCTHADMKQLIQTQVEALTLTAQDRLCITDVQAYLPTVLAGFTQNAHVVLPSKEQDDMKLKRALALETCHIINATRQK